MLIPARAAGNPHVRLFEVNSNNPQPIVSYDGHTTNVTAVGFQKDGKWMYTGSEDGTGGSGQRGWDRWVRWVPTGAWQCREPGGC